jgi:hypothetical protein
MTKADGPLHRIFLRVVDHLDYLVTLTRLRILDALTGPLPETTADRERGRDRERLRRAFPEIQIQPEGARHDEFPPADRFTNRQLITAARSP